MFESLVEQIETRFAELERQMSDPQVIGDRERYAEVGREYRELQPASALAAEWRTLKDDLEGARELLAEDGDDPELKAVVEEAPARLEALEEEIRLAMVERDPNDAKNVLVEIRAGTGGDEAALFAGDLHKMLTRYAEERGFSTETLSQSAAEVGGFKEVTFAVKGEGAYSIFKFEGGTHRVQRVPETESQGRIHTSTATVAVLPEAEEVDVQIDQNDLQIDVYRSSGPGGQSVNTTDSAVRITHKPTGVVVSMQDEKSQLQNKDKAMRVLRARLLERELAEQAGEGRLRAQGAGRQRRALREGAHLQLPPGPRHRPPDQAHLAQPRRGARRRPRRVHRRARGRGETPEAGGGRGRMTPVGWERPRCAGRRHRRPAGGRCREPAPRRGAAARRGDRAGAGRAGRRTGRRGWPRRPGAASARWCGGGCGASRSPTSSAAGASARSSSPSTAGS